MVTKELEGQISIFDLMAGKSAKRKPCEYSFQRYIGQTVRDSWNGYFGKIYDIGSYYTYVRSASGEEYAFTPGGTHPFEFIRDEWQPITDEAVEWDLVRTRIPIVVPIIPSRPPAKIDRVIRGTVNGKPALIGFKEWASGPNDIYKTYEKVLFKYIEKED